MALRDARFDQLPVRALHGGLTLIEADNRHSRNLGLMKLDALDRDDGLHIPMCPAVHTFGMRFALDLIWLGRGGRVVRVDRDVAPGRMRACVRARSVIETNAGRADAFLAGLRD